MNKFCFSSNKKRYSTEKEAERAILLLQNAALILENIKLKIYKCDDCSGWHLTKIRSHP